MERVLKTSKLGYFKTKIIYSIFGDESIENNPFEVIRGWCVKYILQRTQWKKVQ